MNKVLLVITAVCLAWSVDVSAAKQHAAGALPDLMVSSKGSYWQTGTFTKVTGATADVTVDENSKKQLWEGFGGTFNEAGWDALSVVSSEIPNVMKLFFDANDGANFVYGRIPIGASDYAMSSYTLDDSPNDYTMANFSIARDREKLIPFIKAALQVKSSIHLWGSPWIPPAWMKDGSGNMKSDAQTQGAYALYLAKFVEEYAKENLKIEAVHPQNEPGYASVKWNQTVFVDFFKTYLGPKFAERNLTAEIWCGTMSAPADSNIAIACKNDAAVMKYVKGFGLQWNLEAVVPNLAPKGRVWQTEHRCGNYNFDAKYWVTSRYDANKPQNDHLYGEESWQLIRDWVAAGVNAYSAWNMVLDTSGKSTGNWHQNALVVVNRVTKKVIITPAYYVFRHFSQYITPGGTRLGTTGSNDALAFMNPDGTIITEVYNKNDTAMKMTISVRSTFYQFMLPAHGWATLSVKPGSAINDKGHNQLPYNGGEFKATYTAQGYRIALPSRQSGHIELLTAAGRVLESRAIPQGSREILLRAQVSNSGMFLVRVVSGGATTTALLPSTH
ncbi:MAG TPA: glycoside hydrolase family 30 protein [Chitinivibrionales bacterium]